MALITMKLNRGDHVCSIYSTTAELARTVAEFLVDGLQHRQRCWYVASGDETELIRAELQIRDVDVTAETRRGALRLISGDSTYLIRGSFNPEHSIKVFNDAIEQACSDGFTGFRAAADMSWALGLSDGPSQLIIYEALLRSLFSNCNAVGLCLYDRHRMPLDVLDGALATHQKVRSARGFHKNDFYEPARMQLTTADKKCVLEKLQTLDLAI